MGFGQQYLLEWKDDIRRRRYQDFLEASSMIAMLFFKEEDQNWIEVLQKISEFIEGMNDRQILPNVKKYLMDFIEAEIKCIKGEMTKKKLMKERRNTINLISKAHTS